jgi:hypothetical protein
MGKVVFWAIIRTAILIPLLWIVVDFIDFRFWWSMVIISIYGVIIHPAVIQYKLFVEENREVLKNTLCSSCRHFESSAVICLKYDKHPTLRELPCEGLEWEPKSLDYSESENSN